MGLRNNAHLHLQAKQHEEASATNTKYRNLEIHTNKYKNTHKQKAQNRKGGAGPACVAGPRMGLRNNIQPKQQQQQECQITNMSEFAHCVWRILSKWVADLSFIQIRPLLVAIKIGLVVRASEWVGVSGQLGPRTRTRSSANINTPAGTLQSPVYCCCEVVTYLRYTNTNTSTRQYEQRQYQYTSWDSSLLLH